MPKYPGISPYDNEKGTLGTAKKRWEKLYVKEIESDTVSGINASIENLATTATNSVSAAVSAKNDAVSAKQAAEAAQAAAETAAAGIQSVAETDVDNTLSIPGVAADAKVTGDWLRDIAKPVTGDTSLPGPCDEFLQYVEDAEHRLLFGIKRDGSVTWQKGIPQHVKEAMTPTMENDEYLYAILDPEEHVLFAIKKDGTVDWQKGTPKHVINACNPTIGNNEYLYLIRDTEDRVAFGVKKNGSVDWQKGIPIHVRDYVEDRIKDIDAFPLIGKKWAAMGDSLTAPILSYHYYVAQSTGVTVLNYGVNGSRYMPNATSSTSFLERIQNVNPDDFDCITIFGSGNDKFYTLGSVNDTTPSTVFGCVNLTLQAYFDLIPPTKPIGIVTPCPWSVYPPSDVGNWMEEYSNGLITIARKFGIPYMDLYHTSGIRSWDAKFRDAYINDGTHPNPDGHRIFLAPKFRQFILKLI